MNVYKTNQNDIEEVENFWDDKDFNMEYDQKEIPHLLQFHCMVNDIISVIYTKPLTITQGQKILLSGKSGSGKTTLLKAMLGHVYGGIYDSRDNPLCYSDKIEYMCQDARATIPTTRTTIRQIFYDEMDNEKILRALEIVELQEWLSVTFNGDLDAKIENKISGGQKTRLCLAVALYSAMKKNAQWIILDEPDAGIDVELCPNLLKRVINAFPNTTIFLIVHLCPCQLSKIGIKKEWKVGNGGVEEVIYA